MCVHLRLPGSKYGFPICSFISDRAGHFNSQGVLTRHVLLISKRVLIDEEMRITLLGPMSCKILSRILGVSTRERFPLGTVGFSPLLKKNVLSGCTFN